MRRENKPLLQDDPRFFQDITSTAVEVGLGIDLSGISGLSLAPKDMRVVVLFNDDRASWHRRQSAAGVHSACASQRIGAGRCHAMRSRNSWQTANQMTRAALIWS